MVAAPLCLFIASVPAPLSQRSSPAAPLSAAVTGSVAATARSRALSTFFARGRKEETAQISNLASWESDYRIEEPLIR